MTEFHLSSHNFEEDESPATSTLEAEDLVKEWEIKQNEIRRSIIEFDDFDENSLKYIGGVDISYKKGSEEVCAAFVVVEIPSLEVVYENYIHSSIDIDYISTFLAFREAPLLTRLLHDLKESSPSLFPHILLCDGNGILHPRNCGIASHLGVVCDVPSIGVAKTFLQVDGRTQKGVRKDFDEWRKENNSPGNGIDIVGDSGKVLGCALQSTESTICPIYVSCGHKITLESAKKVVGMCCKHRIPEPIRLADLRSREFIRQSSSE